MFTKNSATRGCSRSEVYLSRSSVYRILETRGKLLITNIAVQVLIPDRNNCFCLELESAFGGCVKANSKMSTTVRESTNEGDCKNEPGKQKKVSYILKTYCLLSVIQGKRATRTEKTSHLKILLWTRRETK